MENNYKRSLRRHHQKRIQSKVERYLKIMRMPMNNKDLGRRSRIEANTPKRCGGLCCANPRRVYGQRTIHEMRSSDKFAQEINEYT